MLGAINHLHQYVATISTGPEFITIRFTIPSNVIRFVFDHNVYSGSFNLTLIVLPFSLSASALVMSTLAASAMRPTISASSRIWFSSRPPEWRTKYLIISPLDTSTSSFFGEPLILYSRYFITIPLNQNQEKRP